MHLEVGGSRAEVDTDRTGARRGQAGDSRAQKVKAWERLGAECLFYIYCYIIIHIFIIINGQ